MPGLQVALPWGPEQLTLSLPEEWNLMGVMQPSAKPAVVDEQEEVRRSLAAPIGMPGLAELAAPSMKVAVVVDDDSRPTPMARIFPLVLDELERKGIRREHVTVIPALGVHRPMTEAEIARRVGEAAFAGMRWENPECDNPENLFRLGSTRRGTPVFINKTVAEADLVISIGCIKPHIIASFGGGYKNLVPGVAARITIAHNHALNCRPDRYNNVGRPIDANPMRLDLEEAGSLIRPRVFIVNAVLNSAGGILRVVSGHPIEAHRAGVRVSADNDGARLPALADVVITSSHPMDQDLRQGVTALANTVRALKPGGVMITCVRATEGVGVFGLANAKLPVGRTGLKVLAPLLLPLVPRLRVQGMGEEDRFFLYFALQAMRLGQLLIYAPTIPREVRARLPFAFFLDSPETAVALARRRFAGQAQVLVFPRGGSTYPILPGDDGR